MIRAGVQGGM